MIYVDEAARNIAIDVLDGRQSLGTLKADAAKCEQRTQECRDGKRDMKCPSYVYCYLGRSTGAHGQASVWPVCPVNVIRELNKITEAAKAIEPLTPPQPPANNQGG